MKRRGIFASKEKFIEVFEVTIKKLFAVSLKDSLPHQQYIALGTLLKEEVSKDWYETKEALTKSGQKQCYYFSMEFLLGRMITNNLQSYGVYDLVKEAFKDLKLDINAIELKEDDAGLGNGGLGRLAACFIDSAAALKLPVMGETIRYRYGFFRQVIENGYQIEAPDYWLKNNYIWEIRRPELAIDIPFYGHIETVKTKEGFTKYVHKNAEYVKAVPYDIPIIGYLNNTINTLRLWEAEASYKNHSYLKTEYHRNMRKICEVLYPNDDTVEGKILRLKQQYFLITAGLNLQLKKHYEKYGTFDNLPEKAVYQLNDTHPVLLIPELIRYLVDEHNYPFDKAMDIAKNTIAYTNHTIMPEALERWPKNIFQTLLPRIYQIIEELSRRQKEDLKNRGLNPKDYSHTFIMSEHEIQMANLAYYISFSVNGVAKLHTNILENHTFKDHNFLYPDKLNNKTNGITFRRWLLYSNPELVSFLDKKLGENWKKDFNNLEKLLKYQDDKKVLKEIEKIKFARKKHLAKIIQEKEGITLNPNSIFDIQVKRLHEYKRQLMMILGILMIYNRLKKDPEYKKNFHPHTYIFGAKAAATYYTAKKIIKLINTVADKINNDPDVNDILKVVFISNYNVTYAEAIMPAADVSEQISTASKEASGTGNMKFMLNGAITCGTLDGANVEISKLVGDENIIIFGLSSQMVIEFEKNKRYKPSDIYHNSIDIKEVLDQLDSGFLDAPKDEFKDLKDHLINTDTYFVLKDLHAFLNAQNKINTLYKNRTKWNKMSLYNTANAAFFSSDRTVLEYNKDIWKLKEIKKTKAKTNKKKTTKKKKK